MSNIDSKLKNFYTSLLIEQRGYISKMPDNRSAVFIVSGGMDSISTIARMMIDYNMHIFPLFINRGQSNVIAEECAVDYFDSLFLDKYPNNYNKVFKINCEIPNSKMRETLKKDSIKANGIPLRDTLMEMIAIQYAVCVSEDNKNKIRTIFSANVIDDPYPHSALISMRATNIAICQNMNDWSWQLTSPNTDDELFDELFDKCKEVKWCNDNNVPIEKSFSCYHPKIKNDIVYHCGECQACKRRRDAFLKAGVLDKSLYYINNL